VLIVTLLVVIVGGGAAIAHLANSKSGVRSSTLPGPASATATAIAAAGGILLYQNSFTSDATGWSNGQFCFLGADGFHVNTRTCLVPIGNQTNVDVTVQVKQISGQTVDPFGLVMRADGPQSTSPNQRYEFSIDGNGKWDVVRCDGVDSSGLPQCTDLVGYTANDAIRGGLNITNTLEVKAKGSHFDFYVNGVRVGGVVDSTYPSGKLGLATGQNVECVYTNLIVKALS
jgi:hypothetical protein